MGRKSQFREVVTPVIDTQRFGSWEHASGRIWVLEKDLFGRAGLDRLYGVSSPDEIRGLLLEHHYLQKDTVAETLRATHIAVYELLDEIAPEDGYRVALLLPADAHNMRVMLRESLRGEEAGDYESLARLIKIPSLLDPEILWRAIVAREKDVRLPEWVTSMAEKARLAYAEHYDAVSIDLAVERRLHEMLRVIASELGSDWFEQYLTMIRDLINLEILVRSRLRRVNETLYNASLLPGGLISEERWRALYDGEDGDIVDLLKETPYRTMTPFVVSYGEQGGASKFSRERDILLYGHLSTGAKQLSGPERVLSFIMARELEIRNVKMVLSALVNELNEEELIALRRDFS
ncbi:MAG: V-type ATPase subunit [Saccharofermentanales bacterium]|jgi:V/A-type H+-transporting ATPase subunit C